MHICHSREVKACTRKPNYTQKYRRANRLAAEGYTKKRTISRCSDALHTNQVNQSTSTVLQYMWKRCVRNGSVSGSLVHVSPILKMHKSTLLVLCVVCEWPRAAWCTWCCAQIFLLANSPDIKKLSALPVDTHTER